MKIASDWGGGVSLDKPGPWTGWRLWSLEIREAKVEAESAILLPCSNFLGIFHIPRQENYRDQGISYEPPGGKFRCFALKIFEKRYLGW